MMASDYRKKKRGRKPNASKMRAVVTEEIKAFPASDFEKFMANLKNEPKKSEEDNERESLIFKINKLKLEIENLKELKAVQTLRKSNILLHIDVLKMKYNQLMMDETQGSTSNIPQTQSTPSSSKDSINIKNVIYNNCAQTLAERNKKQSSQDTNSNYDPNFTYIASQLLSFFSDKMDANFASHVDSIKNYTHQIFKNEIETLKNEKRVSPIKIKLNREESVESDEESTKKYVIAEKSNKCARKKTSVSTEVSKPLPPPKSVTPSPPLSPSPPADDSPPPPMPKHSPKKKDLKFEFPEIKVKILEYLCGKVDSNVVVSAFRRLQRSKAYAMLRQTFDNVHNRLLRVYLFEDNNILVQDMTICRNEFSKDMYHAIRYYAIILTTKDSDAVQQPELEIPEPKTKQIEAVPEHCLRSSSSKGDLIILQPCPDNIPRPRFKVDMVQDTMIYEEFELVSRTPFVIRPLFSEVVLSSAQLDLLKPLILKALSSNSQGMPVISIVPKSSNTEVLQDYGREIDTNLFILKNENPTQANYSLSQIKSVVNLAETNNTRENKVQQRNIHTNSHTNPTAIKEPPRNKRKQDLSKLSAKKPKTEQISIVKTDESISFVSVDDIIKGIGGEPIQTKKLTELQKYKQEVDIQESGVKKESVIEECIDLSDDEDESTIIIN